MTLIFNIKTAEKCQICYGPVKDVIYQHQCRSSPSALGGDSNKTQPLSCFLCLAERGVCRYCNCLFTIMKEPNSSAIFNSFGYLDKPLSRGTVINMNTNLYMYTVPQNYDQEDYRDEEEDDADADLDFMMSSILLTVHSPKMRLDDDIDDMGNDDDNGDDDNELDYIDEDLWSGPHDPGFNSGPHDPGVIKNVEIHGKFVVCTNILIKDQMPRGISVPVPKNECAPILRKPDRKRNILLTRHFPATDEYYSGIDWNSL